MLIAAMGGSWVWFLGATVVFGIGNGFVMAPLTTVGMTALRGDEFGAASSLLNVLRQAGPVLGGAVVGLLMQMLAAMPTEVDPPGDFEFGRCVGIGCSVAVIYCWSLCVFVRSEVAGVSN